MKRSGVIVAVALGLVGLAQVSEAAPPDRKALAARAAKADALLKLRDVIDALQVTRELTVGEIFGESETLRELLDKYIATAIFKSPRFAEAERCTVEAELGLSPLVKTLQLACHDYYKGEAVREADFNALLDIRDSRSLRVVGMSRPRFDLPARLPRAMAETLPRVDAPSEPEPLPLVWRPSGERGRLLALQDVRMEAPRQLAARVLGLRLNDKLRVRDLGPERDTLLSTLADRLNAADEQVTYLHDEVLLAEGRYAVPVQQVIAAVKRLRDANGRDDVSDETIDRLRDAINGATLSAAALGPAPKRYIEQLGVRLRQPIPDWACGPIEIDGESEPTELTTTAARLAAALRAEVVARGRLLEYVRELRGKDGAISVLVGQDETLTNALLATLQPAEVTHTRFKTDHAIVTISLPGLKVWEFIRETELRRADSNRAAHQAERSRGK